MKRKIILAALALVILLFGFACGAATGDGDDTAAPAPTVTLLETATATITEPAEPPSPGPTTTVTAPAVTVTETAAADVSGSVDLDHAAFTILLQAAWDAQTPEDQANICTFGPEAANDLMASFVTEDGTPYNLDAGLEFFQEVC